MHADVIVGRSPRRAAAQHPDLARPRSRPDAPDRQGAAPADPPARALPACACSPRPRTAAGSRLTRALRPAAEHRLEQLHQRPPPKLGLQRQDVLASARLEATAKSGLRSCSPFSTPSAMKASTWSRISPVRCGRRAAAPSVTRNAQDREVTRRGWSLRAEQFAEPAIGAASGEGIGIRWTRRRRPSAAPTAEARRPPSARPRAHAGRRARGAAPARARRAPAAARACPGRGGRPRTSPPARGRPEADQPHDHAVRPGRKVHAPELDPLVLEHELAGPYGVRAGDPA